MNQFFETDPDWIEEHISDDVGKLRLKYSSDCRKMFEIIQIDCRQRYQRKLSETLNRCREFLFDSTLAGEQSTSDELAGFHASLINDGDRVFDMTGGLGIDAIHASSRASEIVMAELDTLRAECGRRNFRAMGIENISVENRDSIELLRCFDADRFDVIYIDPARRGEHGERVYALSRCRPDVTVLLDDMLRVARKVIIKASPMLDITQIRRELHSIKRIIAVGTRNECKEVDIVCCRGWDGDCRYNAATISSGNLNEFDFYNESGVSARYASPTIGGWLYEPFPAVSKFNIGNDLCRLPGICQIAPNTHLFVSERRVDFPGLAMEIEDVKVLGKKTLKEIAEKYPLIDVTARNFPMTASELTKRMKVKPSGKIRLIACRDENNANLLVVCRSNNV